MRAHYAAVVNRWRAKSKLLSDWWYQWTLKHLPAGMIARPGEAFIAMMVIFVGIGIITRITEPPSAEQFLNDYLYALWAISLVAGGAALMCGVLSIQWIKPPLVFTISRVAVYKLGLRVLALASGLYGVAQVSATGFNGALAACFTWCFMSFCVARLLTIGRE